MTVDHIGNRDELVRMIRRELVGPDPATKARPVPTGNGDLLRVSSYGELSHPYVTAEDGQEIIGIEGPNRRYGVGALYPPRTVIVQDNPSLDEEQTVGSVNTDDVVEQALKSEDERDAAADPDAPEREKSAARSARVKDRRGAGDEDDDASAFDLRHANSRYPSALAVSFLAELPQGAFLEVRLPRVHHGTGLPVNGRYEQLPVQLTLRPTEEDKPVEVTEFSRPVQDPEGGGRTRGGDTSVTHKKDLWVRRQLEVRARIDVEELLRDRGAPVDLLDVQVNSLFPLNLDLRFQALSRPYDGRVRLLTVMLVNRSAGENKQQLTLFQTHLEIAVVDAEGHDLGVIRPYPTANTDDPEECSNELLYRDTPIFATGHGCAADWSGWREGEQRARTLHAEALPTFQTPSITPVIKDAQGQEIAVPMYGLAGLDPGYDTWDSLKSIIEAYRAWIAEQEEEIPALPRAALQDTARQHLAACKRAAQRMEDGLAYLKVDRNAQLAFRLANHAMLLQQLRDLTLRPARYIVEEDRFRYDAPFPQVQRAPQEGSTRGRWRAFQIAFFLMSLQSTADDRHEDRELVDLIWFPTGGGKTEAYLVLTAFSIFLRRLRDPRDTGVQVLMRYTLRLLTAQQFQRAGTLMCAMDYLRTHPELRGTLDAGLLGPGETLEQRLRGQTLDGRSTDARFAAGIFLGSNTTPNNRDAAFADWESLSGKKPKNRFVLRKCPWCGAQMGVIKGFGIPKAKSGARNKKANGEAIEVRRAAGYRPAPNGGVMFVCADKACDFSARHPSGLGLPLYVIDEDIYAKNPHERPSLVIATVDKFAMLAWTPEARRIFGLNNAGEHVVSPPGLIIQDELHLISGPLGTMVGLLEPVIEALCTHTRQGTPTRPKIVCATATIRAYREQVRALYGRVTTDGAGHPVGHAALFPPPGLEAGDSFFARYARYGQGHPRAGEQREGRLYLGVSGSGFSSLQVAQIKTYSALLHAPGMLPDGEARDPWWTNLTFFNSLRELGTTLTLLQSYVPEQVRHIRHRHALDKSEGRYLGPYRELTGRLPSEEIPNAIADLERIYKPRAQLQKFEPRALDMCLASNIIEVGVDIDRLSLMTITGQPKTTAQYIQVSGRVGRRWEERPGLVVTLYAPTKARDRSHFEKFRAYHQQLYTQVEPTSVTPFSPPALDRALHAAMVIFVRMFGTIEGRSGGSAMQPKPRPDLVLARFRDLMAARVLAVDPDERESVKKKLNERLRQWQERPLEVYTSDDVQGLPLYVPADTYVPPIYSHNVWRIPRSLRNVDAECVGAVFPLVNSSSADPEALDPLLSEGAFA